MTAGSFGIAPTALRKLRAVFSETPGLDRVWIFGSRARGDAREESDIDLAVDARNWTFGDQARLTGRIEALGLLYKVDAVFLQDRLDEMFRSRIERDRRLFWEPRRHASEAASVVTPKKFQTDVLAAVTRYLDELAKHEALAAAAAKALRAMEGMEDAARDVGDFPRKTWNALRAAGALPEAFAAQPHSGRFDGTGRPIPNVCLKVPTGGGKTLLAAACVGSVFTKYLRRHAGLVLWVVPNDAIYRQTRKALTDRDHPYRQMLNVAGAGRVKILEKDSPLSRIDTESNLCVMLLMLQSAARRSKETLRFFRDRGNVLGFLPREDDVESHWALLHAVPNLDAYASWGSSGAEVRAQKGSIVKSSLGNVMRLARPMVVIDEGHRGYSENASRTIDGFNPSFVLELSATPRLGSKGAPGSNILVDVRGTDLDEAEMIKLPIHVDVKPWSDWQGCLGAAVQRLTALADEAVLLNAETARYIRPMLLVQVERTGGDLRDSGLIHADDVRAHLLQLGFGAAQIAVKTSDRNDLAQPENIDLLSPACEVRVIVTRQALQEGWDCPFAYVLCTLAAGRSLAAMTQLVGRILRQPQATRTGRAALDACYVLCRDVKTADVVKAVKQSLESEGLGDLAIAVAAHAEEGAAGQLVELKRRPAFARLGLFLPRVTWVADDGSRRELVYDSDILGALPWHELDATTLARDWAPDAHGREGHHLEIGLEILQPGSLPSVVPVDREDDRFDKAAVVRSLIDLAPNPWVVWDWVGAVETRLSQAGFGSRQLAASSASLIERLRLDVEAERDRLAQGVFDELVSSGRIEFRLRADRTDYELPHDGQVALAASPAWMSRSDGRPVEKSLLEPALRLPGDNLLEVEFACYLDQKSALVWWHRNVAKASYGLQGWKRSRVYPDFVFARLVAEGRTQLVVLETKGLHLAGSHDTGYKQALLRKLTDAFGDERSTVVGQLAFGSAADEVVCDLVFDADWRGTMEHRYFGSAVPSASRPETG